MPKKDIAVIQLRTATRERLTEIGKREKVTMLSLTGSWTKEITAGHAHLTTEVASIRCPCTQRLS